MKSKHITDYEGGRWRVIHLPGVAHLPGIKEKQHPESVLVFAWIWGSCGAKRVERIVFWPPSTASLLADVRPSKCFGVPGWSAPCVAASSGTICLHRPQGPSSPGLLPRFHHFKSFSMHIISQRCPSMAFKISDRSAGAREEECPAWGTKISFARGSRWRKRQALAGGQSKSFRP